MHDHPDTPAVILAGGLARRIGGGDKALKAIAGQTLLARVIARLAPQCGTVVLNANGDPARFAEAGLPVIADSVPGFAGPLAGVLAGMDRVAAHQPGANVMLSVAADTPFLPLDLVARLHQGRTSAQARIAVAASGGRSHPVIGLWDVALRDELRDALAREGLRKVGQWIARYRVATVDWPVEPFDPFFNANTPEDFATAERLAAREPD